MASSVRLYLDENLNPAITEQLRIRGIDALCVRDLGAFGESDPKQLQRAIDMGRVIVTTDIDFLRIASETTEHTGIIFGEQRPHSIGDWVNALELICFVYTAEDMLNRVEYL